MTTKIGQILNNATAIQTSSFEISQRESPEPISRNPNGECSVSLYTGDLAEPREIAVSISRLMTAFPKMGDPFFNLLAERVRANKFTTKRLNDAINHLIDNFNYKELNIADIIKFDKRAKLYSYNDVCKMVSKGEATFSDFAVKEINGTHYRVKKTDIE